MRIWKFHRLSTDPIVCDGVSIQFRRIAFSEADMHAELNGEMACVDAPAQPLSVRLWRKLFPLKGVECQLNQEHILEQ